MNRSMGQYVVVLLAVPLIFATWSATADRVPRESGSALFSRYARPELTQMIDSTANQISDSTHSLAPFIDKLMALRSGEQGVVSILHIGDSHVQAGYIDQTLRELFQSDFGNAGRGLVVPLKLMKTNGPLDYAVTSPNSWTGYKCTDQQSSHLGVSAMALETADTAITFTIAAHEKFSVVRVLHDWAAPMLSEPDSLSIGSYCTDENTQSSTKLVLNTKVNEVTVMGRVNEQFPKASFYGFSLENGESGVLYHNVGVNGATFNHFTKSPEIVAGQSDLRPDMVIVSLGTNECYGNNFNSDYIYTQITNIIEQIRCLDPAIPILFVTPMESCSRRTVRGRRSYVVNKKVGLVADIIVKCASQHGVAYWDLHKAAGGQGANARWNKEELVARDRIHFSVEGYRFQAEMLYDAFAKYYNNAL